MARYPEKYRSLALKMGVALSITVVALYFVIYKTTDRPSNPTNKIEAEAEKYALCNESTDHGNLCNIDEMSSKALKVITGEAESGDFIAANIVANHAFSRGDKMEWRRWKERASSAGSCIAIGDLRAISEDSNNKSDYKKYNELYEKRRCNIDIISKESNMITQKVSNIRNL